MSNHDPNSPSDFPNYGSATPPPGGYPPPAPGGYGMPAQTNTKAIVSLVLGILSLFCCGLVFGIVAIALSRTADREIRESHGAQTGAGLAKAGLITGIIGLAFWALYLVLVAAGVIDLSFDFSTS